MKHVTKILIYGLPAIVVGMGFYALYFSEGLSYLSDDPKACINCHVMSSTYATWRHSSHARVATCNDCHVPHENIVKTYWFKAKDGFNHSYVFTTKSEPQVIRAKGASKEVIHDNCIRCHNHTLVNPKLQAMVPGHTSAREKRACWDCHREVPHGRVNSLSAIQILQDNKYGKKSDIVPKWMKEDKSKK